MKKNEEEYDVQQVELSDIPTYYFESSNPTECFSTILNSYSSNDINFDDILYFCQSFHNFLYYVKLFDFNELKSIILSTDIIEVLNKTFEHEHENNDSYISLVINDLIV